MLDVKVRNKEVKSILSSVFGSKNVSVTNGKGTSWGWCHISIKMDKSGCTGDEINGYPSYCTNCRLKIKETHEIADRAIKDVEFSTYYDDEGYQDKRYSIHLN